MRLAEIDRSKGLAIFLVVLGHFASSQTTHYVPNWYRVFHDLIYSFHMPFFMFISGVVVSYSCPNLSSARDWGRFVRKKFWRLMPAFFLFGSLIFLGKTALQQILYVDNPVNQPISILSMLIFPHKGHATSLWYIYVLFEICCIYPVLMWVFRQRTSYLLVLGLLMQMVGIYAHVPDLFGLEMLCQMFPFFVFGALFVKHYEVYSRIIDRYLALFVFAFCATLLLRAFVTIHIIVTGIVAIPACLGISRRWRSGILNVLGVYCFPIYLMHMIFIGFTKGIVLHFVALSDPMYSVLFIVCCISGLCFPVLVKVYMFRYVGWLNRITA